MRNNCKGLFKGGKKCPHSAKGHLGYCMKHLPERCNMKYINKLEKELVFYYVNKYIIKDLTNLILEWYE